MTVGIFALQGAFAEHASSLDALGVEYRFIRQLSDFDTTIDRIILPGGESTTQGKLLHSTGLFEPVRKAIHEGMPAFGTCAGMILLAHDLENDENTYFDGIDITVRRNAYGRQLGSFATQLNVGAIENFPLVFIRAPFVTRVGDNVDVLASVDDHVVAVQSNNVLATAFHPELTTDTRIHEYFLGM